MTNLTPLAFLLKLWRRLYHPPKSLGWVNVYRKGPDNWLYTTIHKSRKEADDAVHGANRICCREVVENEGLSEHGKE